MLRSGGMVAAASVHRQDGDDATRSARAAGLHYVSDDRPGLTRKRRGKGFAYYGPDGRRVTDEDTLARIRRLAIPPAYTDVWICLDPRGHVQATARDARGRKQYRYHPHWREVRDTVKYDRMLAFADVLPRIRERCDRDLERPGLPREKVLATVVQLLEQTRIRVGNEEYVKQNRSFGLTTLRNQHVRVQGPEVRFAFRGKSGKRHEVRVRDRRLARVVRRCLDIPGQELFQYVDHEGSTHTIDSGDVNAYIQEVAGDAFTAKDFRTWAGTVLAASELRRCPPCRTKREGKRQLVRAIEEVSARLGNTPSVCRKSYVHPAVLEAYLESRIAQVACDGCDDEGPCSLHAMERFTRALLRAEASRARPTLTTSLKRSIAKASKRTPVRRAA